MVWTRGIPLLLFAASYAVLRGAEQPSEWGGLLKRGDEAAAVSNWQGAVDAYERALTVSRTFGPADDRFEQTLTRLANACLQAGDGKKAVVALREIVWFWERRWGREDVLLAPSVVRLARAMEHEKNWTEAGQQYARAALLVERAADRPERPDLTEIYLGQGRCAAAGGDDYFAAEAFFRKALVRRWTTHGREDPATGEVEKILGDINLQFIGRPKPPPRNLLGQAETRYHSALSIFEKVYGKEDVRLLPVLQGLADAYGRDVRCRTMNAKKQIDIRLRILAIMETKYGKESPEILPALEGLARAHEELEQVPLARVYWQRVAKLLEKEVDGAPERAIEALDRLSTIAANAGWTDEAVKYLQRLATHLEAQPDRQEGRLQKTWNRCAALLRGMGREQEAIAIEQRTQALRTRTPTTPDPSAEDAWSERLSSARSAAAMLRRPEAMKAYRAAVDAAAVLGTGDTRYVATLREAAEYVFHHGQVSDRASAIEWYRKGLHHTKAMYGEDSVEAAKAEGELGVALTWNAPKEAETHVCHAFEVLERKEGKNAPTLGPWALRLATLQLRSSGAEFAIPTFRRAMALLKKTPGAWDDSEYDLEQKLKPLCKALTNLGFDDEAKGIDDWFKTVKSVFEKQRVWQEKQKDAERQFAKGLLQTETAASAVKLAEDLGQDRPYVWISLLLLANLQEANEDYENAESTWLRMIMMQLQNQDAPSIVPSYELHERLGAVLLIRTKVPEATASLKRALAEREKTGTLKKTSAVPLLVNLATLFRHQKAPEAALLALRTAWALQAGAFGWQSAQAQRERARLVAALREAGHAEEADRLPSQPPPEGGAP